MPLAARIAVVVLAAWSLAGAEARPASGFGAPLLDGATPLSEGPGGLTPTRFMGGRDWPALRFHAAPPLDWSRAAALTVPVENPGDESFRLLLRLDDDPAADGGDRSLTGLATVPAHAHGTVVLPLDAGPAGMRGRPVAAAPAEAGDIAVTDLRGTVDLHHIVALHVSGVRTGGDRVLGIGPPQLRDRAAGQGPVGPIADRYGQAVAGRWPEKVASDAALCAKLADAATQTRRLAQAAPLAQPRPVSAATGFFRVEKADGGWRFVDPAGRAFFSLGVDAVTPSNPTIVEGRRGLFAEPPASDAPLDVGEANLARAYGPDWRRRWAGTVIGRLKAWGFNTLGNWSDPALAAGGLATVTFTDIEGASARVPMEGGRALPDPFDPRYPAVADAVATTMTAAHRAEPALLGYFSGNEMPWGSADRPETGLAAHVLRLGRYSPAKQVLVGILKERYGSAGRYASAWGLPAGTGWAMVLDTPVAIPMPPTPAARDDIAGFERAFADRYFSIVAQAIRAHDPDHLYLGTRFADAPPAVVAACARWCDVLSFNVYGATPAEAAARWRAFDRPVLIGEFHFGSTDRGSFWPGMVDAGSEAARGPAYAAYLETALKDPAIVGVHWYQYADEPLTGRPYDGENGHIGLVAVTDIPYAGFVEVVARANREALRTRGAGGRVVGTIP